MTDPTVTEPTQGATVLHAVERLLASNDQIRAVAERYRTRHGSEEAWSRRIVEHYAKRSGVVGGATALPAMVPGVGTALALTAGPIADLVLLLKLEVEMALALSYACGADLDDPAERQLAFLLAAVRTHDVMPGRSCVSEVSELSVTALVNYGPRRLNKLLLEVVTLLVGLSLARGFARVVPVLGLAVGSVVNYRLTRKVGREVYHQLALRRSLTSIRA